MNYVIQRQSSILHSLKLESNIITISKELGIEKIKVIPLSDPATAVSSGYFIIGTIMVVTAVVFLATLFLVRKKIKLKRFSDSHIGLIPIQVKR